MTDDEGYLLDNQQTEAKRHFDALSALFDPSTFRHFDQVWIAPGRRCWEVGAGGPTAAAWIAQPWDPPDTCRPPMSIPGGSPTRAPPRSRSVTIMWARMSAQAVSSTPPNRGPSAGGHRHVGAGRDEPYPFGDQETTVFALFPWCEAA